MENEQLASAKQVLICQSKTCRKGGSARVLAAFEKCAVAEAAIEASGCLGQCGNGPMVLVLPDDVWYCRVQPGEVPTVVQQHLQKDSPVQAMLYRKFHPMRR
ncbi:(2Fe-2S) ferredoxin domain-containing protein [Oculatella sp. LEGE 06141]|uniref:NAD(P)H-dependent oxidoreductase subunit E n=1 Tax=Oculatella sp. LEGE 06141 TaxID=1828648 RepID=UPI00187E93DE|nr:(2Fe-2S) ferredoxin domain-containing protein [Oculatella sp. LEGE 06141]